MTKLSPAAQAVLDAFLGDAAYTGLQMDDLRENVAAALRVAADESAPEKQLEDITYIHESYINGMRDALACIEIIAAELEAQ